MSQLLENLAREISTLRDSNESLIAALANQDSRHQADIESLREELQSQRQNKTKPSRPGSIHETTPPTLLKEGQTLHRTERLPDPPMFNGKRKDLTLFITKLRFKLEGNADRYPDERSKIIYAHSRLERDPATLIDPMMDKDIHSVEQLLAFLKATYDDPNKELSAWSKLDALKQGKKGFLSHFAEFRRLVADTELNESAQISHLRRTLSDELRRAMVGVLVPHNLNNYANLIAQYDNDLRYLPSRPTQRPTHVAAVRRDPDAMEIDASKYAPAGSAEREKRIKEGRCFKCNSKNHISRNCSVPLPAVRSNSTTRSPSRSRSRSKDALALTRTRRLSSSSVLSISTDHSHRSTRRSRKQSPKGKSRA